MEFDFDLEQPLPTTCNDNFPLLFHIETDHMPSKTYLQTLKAADHSSLSTRRQTVSLIRYSCRNQDPFSTYLAINYMDRFLSAHSLTDWKPWILKLVAVSCISLALKMRKTGFSVSDFQDDGGGMILNSVTIERTEMIILGALKWRMRSINPFSFLSFFIQFFQFKDQKSTQALKDRATEIILTAQNEIKLLKFNPSIISASALLNAAGELFPVQLPCFRNSISSCEYVNKENLCKCYNLMAAKGESVLDMASSSCTPDNVLDLQYCISSSTSDKAITETRSTNTEIRSQKRRKFGENITTDS